MNWLLLDCDRVESAEHRVDVLCVGAEIEQRIECDARRDLLVAAGELAEVELLVPRAHRVALDEAVCLVARQAGFDKSEQHALAEEQVVARLEVPAHALLP